MSSFIFYSLLAVIAGAIALLLLPLRPFTRPLAALALTVAVAGAAAVLLWPPPGERIARGKKLIELALPRYQFAERHQTIICAPAQRIADAIHHVPPGEIRFYDLLTWLRGMPGAGDERPILDLALASNFVLLADTQAELLLGTAVDFSKPTPGRFQSVKGDVGGFSALDVGGIPKVVFNFAIDPAPFGCQAVTTETRIHTGKAEIQRQFAAYWRVIQPGSALLRRTWLKAIRRRAEAK